MARSRKTVKLLTWIISLIVIVGGGYGVSLYLKKQEEKKILNVIKDREVKVSKKDIKKILQLTGKVLPSSSINIYSPVSGQIVNILVREGDRVKASQPLFAVKQDSTGEKELENRRNDVESSRLELQSAEENLNRLKSVAELFSASEQEKTEMEYQRRKLALEGAQERLSLLEESLGIGGRVSKGNTKNSQLSTIFVTAPRNSFVTLISKSIGDAVIGTTSGNQSTDTDVMTLSDTDKMMVRAKVLESDLESLSPGIVVDVKLDALKDKIYKGKIFRISQQGIDDKAGGFTYFMTDISIDDADSKVRAQMNASLKIFVAEKKDVLALPVDAVATSGEHSVVELNPKKDEPISNEMSPNYKEIKVGLAGDDYVEIISDDLKEGDTVLKIDYAKIDPKNLAAGIINDTKDKAKKKPKMGHGPGR